MHTMENFLGHHEDAVDLHDLTDLWDKQAPGSLQTHDHQEGFSTGHEEVDFHQAHMSGYDASDLFYSPVLSLNVDVDGTPLISPPDPAELPPDFSMPPSFFSIHNQNQNQMPNLGHEQETRQVSGKSLAGAQSMQSSASHTHQQQPHHSGHFYANRSETDDSDNRSYGNLNSESPTEQGVPHAAVPSQHNSKSQSTASSANPQSSAPRSSRRSGSTGKIIKQSPLSRPTRWSQQRPSKSEEEELAELEGFPPAFIPSNAQADAFGEEPGSLAGGSVGTNKAGSAVTPAMIMNLGNGGLSTSAEVDEKFQDRLQAAIRATAASSTTSSRKSSVTSIRSPKSLGSTPRIVPRTNSTSGNAQLHANTSSTSLDDESALLESKSNYQQIVDGTHHRLGFTSPDKLSTDVRSKKTSHKIAEQERRNRINTGLMELGKLVSPASDVSLSSKAAIVEAAIEYIHRLHRRLATLESSVSSVSASQSASGSPASASSTTPPGSSSSS